MSSAIGVFDSGLGGLTILRALKEAFPKESFLYLGDTARLPYGTKSPHTIRRYAQQIVHELEGREVKAIVVACNSASAAIREEPLQTTLPIFEVIAPGSREALHASRDLRIGVIGTYATISNGAYSKCLRSLNPNVKVFSKACPLLVPLVEEGWVDDPLTNLVIHRYLGSVLGQAIDTLILGCTHYPILASAVRKVVGPHIALVDPAQSLVKELKRAFAGGELIPRRDQQSPQLKILITDQTARFKEMAQLLLGEDNTLPIEVVDL